MKKRDEPYPVGTKVYVACYRQEQRSTITDRLINENVWVENVPAIVMQLRETEIRRDHFIYTYKVAFLDGTIMTASSRQVSLTKMKKRDEPYPVGTKVYATYWGNDGEIHYDKPCVVQKILLDTDATCVYQVVFVDGIVLRILSNQLSVAKKGIRDEDQWHER